MNIFQFIKLVFISLSLTMAVLLFTSLRFVTDNETIKSHREFHSDKKFYLSPKVSYQNIFCYFGLNTKANCLNNNSSIYLPFDLIKKKFDVSGQIDSEGNFQITPSSHRIFYPVSNYYSKGEFLWFGDNNVESRDRVKYISLIENVPITSQWKKSGHFYPIQIAQYGLSHFSRWFKDQKKINYYKNFSINQKDHFLYVKQNGIFVQKINNGFRFNLIERSIYRTNYSFNFGYLLAEVSTNSSFNISVDLVLRNQQIPTNSQIIRLIYSFNAGSRKKNEIISTKLKKDNSYEILYKLNGLNGYQKIIRNFCVDSCKALGIKSANCFKQPKNLILSNGSEYNRYFKSLYFKVYQIGLIGEGQINNGVFFEKSPSYEIAKQAADFLLSSQNVKSGGWMINVTRKFASDIKEISLEAGWHSSMAQGHAISLLCRLYSQTKNEKYYKSARNALNLFQIDTKLNGVKTNFLNSSLVWFEEYPTKPKSLFVLNGFVFSIFGIFDFLDGCQNIKDSIYFNRAKNLFENAVHSLTKLINLFDIGTRTLYDLGHLVDAEINPNVARWDYHCVHVSQLNYLVNILENLNSNFDQNLAKLCAQKLKVVKKRWENYAKGIWLNKSQIKN